MRKIFGSANNKGVLASATALGLTIVSSGAFAAVDTAATLTGITDAGTAILAIVGALLALSVSIFGVVKVYNFVSKKAGA